MTIVYRSAPYRTARTGRFDIGRLGERFATTYDPSTAVEAFGRALLRAAATRVKVIGDGLSENLDFALGVLHPVRIRSIATFMDAGRVHTNVLTNYVGVLRADMERRIAAADDVDSVADVVVQALDDLHAYVLAHELVSDGYREAERRMFSHLEGGSHRRDSEAGEVAVSSPEAVLALAA